MGVPTGHAGAMSDSSSLAWTRETAASWDGDKVRIVGAAPKGSLPIDDYRPGDPVAGDWWRASDAGRTVGYGWMDQTWNGAEILLAVDPETQRRGVGTFILDRLEDEAAARGLNYMFNVVRESHPQRESVTAWLESRGFAGTHGDLRRRVRQR